MNKLSELWSETELVDKLGLEPGKERSRLISSWISQGLKCLYLSGWRYFREEDIVSFFNKKFETCQND